MLERHESLDKWNCENLDTIHSFLMPTFKVMWRDVHGEIKDTAWHFIEKKTHADCADFEKESIVRHHIPWNVHRCFNLQNSQTCTKSPTQSYFQRNYWCYNDVGECIEELKMWNGWIVVSCHGCHGKERISRIIVWVRLS